MNPSSMWNRFGHLILISLIVIAAFVGGTYVGNYRTLALTDPAPQVINKETGKPTTVDFSPFWQAWEILNDKYVATKENATSTDQDRVWGAIKGLADSYGDPYTTFFPPKDAKSFREEITGNFEGVGIELGVKDDVLTVIAPLKNSPADKAGIKAGDRILKINDAVTSGMTTDDAIKLIRGKQGTTVILTVLGEKDKSPRDISITRDVINVPTIDTEQKKDVFIIHLYSFTENSPQLFKNALQEFVNTKSNKLILDLRGNPGGYLEAAVDMASWFLPTDAIIVKEDAGGNGTDAVYKSRGYNIFNKNLKMVILVDEGSASASEILAGALSEHGVAKLVGAQTFGKGSVQELISLTPETSLKITVARWLTPNGLSISDHGLTPDIVVKEDIANAAKGIDDQTVKAIEFLNTP